MVQYVLRGAAYSGVFSAALSKHLKAVGLGCPAEYNLADHVGVRGSHSRRAAAACAAAALQVAAALVLTV